MGSGTARSSTPTINLRDRHRHLLPRPHLRVQPLLRDPAGGKPQTDSGMPLSLDIHHRRGIHRRGIHPGVSTAGVSTAGVSTAGVSTAGVSTAGWAEKVGLQARVVLDPRRPCPWYRWLHHDCQRGRSSSKSRRPCQPHSRLLGDGYGSGERHHVLHSAGRQRSERRSSGDERESSVDEDNHGLWPDHYFRPERHRR